MLHGQEKECGDFAEATAFKRYGARTSEKANMHNEHWLTSTRFSPFGEHKLIFQFCKDEKNYANSGFHIGILVRKGNILEQKNYHKAYFLRGVWGVAVI